MVFFTCQNCGDPVKKPSVEKHYNTKCRNRDAHLTCVDCLKDFGWDDYGSHNQCMTELQRYSAPGTVFKEEKGKKKQEQYIEMIQRILNSKDLTLSSTHRSLIEVCANHDNVPRKLKRFENFMKNVARSVRCNAQDIHFVFNVIEGACQKQELEISKSKAQPSQLNKTSSLKEESKNNEVTPKDAEEEVADDKKGDKSKKKRTVEKTKSSKDENNLATNEEICNGGNVESINDQFNLNSKKAKKKKPHDISSLDHVDNLNGVPEVRSSQERTEDIRNNESSETKKEKRRKKSLALEDEDVSNLEKSETCADGKNVSDSKDAISDDIKENVNKFSKKQLKKQNKYEKYLEELENVATSGGNKTTVNANVEESCGIKKNKRKIKNLKANESESQGLVEDKNAVNINDSFAKAEIKNKKKRKLEECVGDTPEKKIKESSEQGEGGSAAAVFNWGEVIMSVLQSQVEKELSLKKLGKKVIKEYLTLKQDHRTYEELLAKFNKKVNKIKGVRVLRDRAKLIE